MKRILSALAVAALATGVLAVPATAADFDATVHVVKDASPGTSKSGAYDGIALKSRLIYAYENTTNGNELWTSDGSKAGTHLLKDIWPGAESSAPYDFTRFKGRVYFHAENAQKGEEIWVTDGTAAGTKIFKDIQPGPGSSDVNERQLVAVGDTLYFAARVSSGPNAGAQVWKTDGVPAHTSVVQAIRAMDGTTFVSGLARWGDRVVFSAKDDLGVEPWMSDGTTAVMLKDINAGPGDSNPASFRAVGTRLLFTAKPTGNGGSTQLWYADAPSGNFVLPFPLIPSPGMNDPTDLVVSGNTLYFLASSGTTGEELWKSDGTVGGTELAADINPSPGVGGSISDLTAVGSSVYFSARDGANNGELWKAGSGGVTKVAEINPGLSEGSYPGDFVPVGSTLYFSAKRADIGYELFRTDGTAAGTKLVKDVAPGTYDSYADPLVTIGSTLFFTAQTPALSDELWVYTTKASTTKGYPKASYSRKTAAAKKLHVTVKVRATSATPTGKVVLRQGKTVVGSGVLKNGVASIRITKAWGKGVHKVRAYYTGSVVARSSHSALIRIKVA